MWSFPGLADISAVLSKSVPLSDEDMLERKSVLCVVVMELCSLRDRTSGK